MVDDTKPADATTAGAAAHNPTAQPGAATVEPSAAAAPPVQNEAAPAAKTAEATPSTADSSVKDAAPAEPKVEPGLLEKFDKDKAEKDAEAKAAKPADDKAAKPADDKTPKPDVKDGDKKPDDAAKAADVKKDDAKPVEPVKPEPIDYSYKLPDTLTMDDAQKGELSTVLDAFRADPKANVQQIIDFGAARMQDFATNYAAETLKNQFKVFNDTKAGWEKQVLADQEIGGAGHLTAMAAIARVRDLAISSAKPGSEQYKSDLKEYEHFLAATGAGSHPAHLRMLHNIARYIDEPQATSNPSNIKPAPNNGKAPGGFKETMYDNPRSNPNGRQ